MWVFHDSQWPHILECCQANSLCGLNTLKWFDTEVSFIIYMSAIISCAGTEKIFRLEFMYVAW